MNIEQRLERLHERRTNPMLFEASKNYEGYRSLNAPGAARYIIGSMQPIDSRYTERTLEQGVRVREQLKKVHEARVQYRFQGSVTTDTHIRQHSDIDLLVLEGKFTFCKPPLEAKHPYQGDASRDLRELRKASRDKLKSAFPQATVDDSGSRSIEIQGGSLARKVDVVPAAFLDTVEYEQTGDEVHRGVKVFDKSDESFSANYPFRNAHAIALKDRRCTGGLRKAVRFLKTVAADAEAKCPSSYDICAIAWNMDDAELSYGMPWDLKIFYACRDYLRLLVGGAALRDSLWVPDGSRKVFTAGKATREKTLALLTEVEKLATELESTMPTSSLVEPKLGIRLYRVNYPIFEHQVRAAL